MRRCGIGNFDMFDESGVAEVRRINGRAKCRSFDSSRQAGTRLRMAVHLCRELRRQKTRVCYELTIELHSSDNSGAVIP